MNMKWSCGPGIATALAVFAVSGMAQDDPFALDWVEDEAPAPHFTSSIEVGVGWLDDDAFMFGKFTGLTRSGFVPMLDVFLEQRPAWDGDSTVHWRFEGQRLGLDSRRLYFEAGEQGRQRVYFGYRQIPNNTLGGGHTPFSGAGGGFLSLPGDWEATGNSTAGMTMLEQSLQPVDIGHTRRRLDFGYRRILDDPRWTVDFDYRRETKEGTRVVGAAFGSTGGNPRSAIVPAPVDFVTDIVDAVLRYDGKDYQVGVAYHGSVFDNNQASFAWQNPFGQHPQWTPGTGFPDGLGRIGLEPANDYHQLRAFASWSASPATRLTADFAVGRMSQDMPFLPYTVNPRIDVHEPLPRVDLDGRIDTTIINLRLTTRPQDRTYLTATYRYDDRDNRTPIDAYRYVAGDSQDQKVLDDARINRPYSFREHRFDLAGTYRMPGRTRLTGGYQYRSIDRTISESDGSTEHTLRLGVRGEPLDSLSVSLDYSRSERDAEPYDGRVPFVQSHVPGTVTPDDFENHPLLRKFFLTDRDRDRFALRADWVPAQNFNIGLAGNYARDRFDDTFFGLNEGKVRGISLDGGYHPSDTASFTAWMSRDRFEAGQSGRAFAPGQEDDVDRNWFADSVDRIDSFGLGFVSRGTKERDSKLDLGADVVFSRSRTELDVSGGQALTVAQLPDLTTRLNAYTAYARYHLNDAASVRFGIEHERFSSRDFALDGVAPDTLANVLTLGEGSPNYSVNWVTVTYRYRF